MHAGSEQQQQQQHLSVVEILENNRLIGVMGA